jgi:hypothetical protein
MRVLAWTAFRVCEPSEGRKSAKSESHTCGDVQGLAEAGCSANEIAAITGHVTLEEVARYTRATEQKKLARSAMARLAGERGWTPITTSP